MMTLNIPKTDEKRIVIVGAGFGGFVLARKLKNTAYQVVLIDRNNFHQFQPLYYQVAMAGLEPSSISFPLRKTFQKSKNVLIRIAEMEGVDHENKTLFTNQGELSYDYLVIATGAVTNFFGNKDLEEQCFTLKSVRDALDLRNSILSDFETAVQISDYDERQKFIDIVIVGGGPTGVELAGSLAEMRKFILPKDYQELDNSEMDIYLVQGANNLLFGMDESLGKTALKYLEELGVKVILNDFVTKVDNNVVYTKKGEEIIAGKVIWAAGIKCPDIRGLKDEALLGRGNRLKVNVYNQLIGVDDVYVLGDAAMMITEEYPNGHPQVAQPSIQQGKNLAKNFKKMLRSGELTPFKYRDLGTMATIGRNKAVAQLNKVKYKGFAAWATWLFVHLYALVGVKNRIVVMINWMWNYLTYDQSLRIIIKPEEEKSLKDDKLHT